jgi:hypothetical protein
VPPTFTWSPLVEMLKTQNLAALRRNHIDCGAGIFERGHGNLKFGSLESVGGEHGDSRSREKPKWPPRGE